MSEDPISVLRELADWADRARRGLSWPDPADLIDKARALVAASDAGGRVEEWKYVLPYGSEARGSEAEVRRIASKYRRAKLFRRTVGPWVEVPATPDESEANDA